MTSISQPSVKERLIDAAFDLFDTRGYDKTTVDDIAEHAGVGRTTFFRNLRTKEDAIFPDHDAILAAVNGRLATATADTALIAMVEAARLVLRSYLADGQRARQRYALAKNVAALRARETAGIRQYQRLFTEFIGQWIGEGQSLLRAELMANAVVTAHNHVLRRWLRAESTSPEREFDDAMREVLTIFADQPTAEAGILIVRTAQDLSAMLPALRRLLDASD